MSVMPELGYDDALRRRHRASAIFAVVCRASTWFALIILLVLLVSLLHSAWQSQWLNRVASWSD